VLFCVFTGELYTVTKMFTNGDTVNAIPDSESHVQLISSFRIILLLFFVFPLLTFLALFSFTHSLFGDPNFLRHDDVSINK
jgi:hypothetical protein